MLIECKKIKNNILIKFTQHCILYVLYAVTQTAEACLSFRSQDIGLFRHILIDCTCSTSLHQGLMEPEHLISVYLSVNQYLKASDSQTPKTDPEEAAVTRFVSPLSLFNGSWETGRSKCKTKWNEKQHVQWKRINKLSTSKYVCKKRDPFHLK